MTAQQRLLRGVDALAPQVARVAQLDLVVVHPQVDRLRRLPLHHDGIVTGVLEGRSPVAAEAGIGEPLIGIGLRAQAAYGRPPRIRRRGAGQRPDGEDQTVLRVEGAGARRDLIPGDARGDAPPADVFPTVLHRGFGPDLPGAQIDAQELACPAAYFIRHDRPPCSPASTRTNALGGQISTQRTAPPHKSHLTAVSVTGSTTMAS